MAYLGYSEDFELDDDGILRDSMSCMYNCTLYVSQQFMHKNDNILLIDCDLLRFFCCPDNALGDLRFHYIGIK